MSKKKITELTFVKNTTREYRDANGQVQRERVDAEIKRKVKVIAGGKRFAHFFIDAIAFQVILTVLTSVWGTLTTLLNASTTTAIVGGLSINLAGLLAYPAYYFLFEHYLGKTPGKYLTKTTVIDVYGNRPPMNQLIIRSIVRIVPFEVLSCAFNDRGWHDRWSDTYVVSDEEKEKLLTLLHEANSSDKVGAGV